MITETGSSSRLDGIGASEGQRQLLLALLEAVESPTGGEVIVRGGRESGRIRVSSGRIAWANVSTVPETFGARLARRGLMAPSDVAEVVEECRKTGANFAELAVRWGLVSAETMRAEFLDQTATSLAHAFRLPGLQCIFAPIQRSYGGTLLLPLEELLDEMAARGIAPPPLLSERRPGEGLPDLLDRIATPGSGARRAPGGGSLDLDALRSLKGLLAASVTSRQGGVSFLGGVGGLAAQDATPPLERVFAAANQASAQAGLGSVLGLWISSPGGTAVVQEFSGGEGLVRCIFGPGTNAPLVRIRMESILSALDGPG